MGIIHLHNLIVRESIPIHGVSPSSGVHYQDAATDPQKTRGNGLATGFKALTVTTDKTQIVNDNLDTATITCTDPLLVGDTTVDYAVFRNDLQVVARASAPLPLSLTFHTIVAGEFEFWLYQEGAGTASGYVIVKVVEA